MHGLLRNPNIGAQRRVYLAISPRLPTRGWRPEAVSTGSSAIMIGAAEKSGEWSSRAVMKKYRLERNGRHGFDTAGEYPTIQPTATEKSRIVKAAVRATCFSSRLSVHPLSSLRSANSTAVRGSALRCRIRLGLNSSCRCATAWFGYGQSTFVTPWRGGFALFLLLVLAVGLRVISVWTGAFAALPLALAILSILKARQCRLFSAVISSGGPGATAHRGDGADLTKSTTPTPL